MMNKVFLLLLPILLLAGCTHQSTNQKVEEFVGSDSSEIIQEVIYTGSQNTDNAAIGNIVNDDECEKFTDNLATCTPYVCTFTHPFSETKMQKTIKGLGNGLCMTEETMPNNGLLTCNYTAEERVLATKYFKAMENMTELKASASRNGNSTESTEIIDGEKQEWTLQNMIENGHCKVSGYEDYE